MGLIDFPNENFKNFSTRHRALIFDMYLPNCSNYAPRAKNGPALVVTCFTQAYSEKHEIMFLAETT